jgi:hypothetical protein
MFHLLARLGIEYEMSVARYPNIKPGEDFKGYPTTAGG